MFLYRISVSDNFGSLSRLRKGPSQHRPGRADALEQGLLENVEEKNPMKEVRKHRGAKTWTDVG